MKAECKADDHDHEDDRNRKKGEDDVLEENDVFSNTHVLFVKTFGRNSVHSHEEPFLHLNIHSAYFVEISAAVPEKEWEAFAVL